MRELKFRARHYKSGAWYYGTSSPIVSEHTLNMSLFWLEVEDGTLDRNTIEEYKGFRDKNNAEIYE